jgi:hypothetical protein
MNVMLVERNYQVFLLVKESLCLQCTPDYICVLTKYDNFPHIIV